jgi:hypothetical protein
MQLAPVDAWVRQNSRAGTREVLYTDEDVEVSNRWKRYPNLEGPLKLGFVLLLLMCALLFSQGKQAPFDMAKCLATCNNRCTANLNTCRKAAKNDTAKLSCQKSYDLCGSICVNKACSAPAK